MCMANPSYLCLAMKYHFWWNPSRCSEITFCLHVLSTVSIFFDWSIHIFHAEKIQLSASQRKFTRRASSNSLVVRESSKLSCKKCSRWTLKRWFFARLLEMFRWRYQCFNVSPFPLEVIHSFSNYQSEIMDVRSFNFCIWWTHFFGAFLGMEMIKMLWHL